MRDLVLLNSRLNPAMLLVASAWLFIVSCEPVLGVEGEREVDTELLDAKGYPGCAPRNSECDACTSSWHECVCQGWYDRAEDKERRDLLWICAGEHEPPEGVALDRLRRGYEELRDAGP